MLKGLEHRGQWNYPEIRTSGARGARGENGIVERHICCINEAGVGKTVGTGVCEQEAISSDSPAVTALPETGKVFASILTSDPPLVLPISRI